MVRIVFQSAKHRKKPVRTAVGDRLELLVGSLVREPSLDVVLDSSSVVEGTRNNRYDSVRQTKRLVKALRVSSHRLEHLHRLLWLSDAELR